MARMSIRKAAAVGLLVGGTLGLAAPAAGGVTVLEAGVKFEVYGLASVGGARTEVIAVNDPFADGVASRTGGWGSFTASSSSTDADFEATTNAVAIPPSTSSGLTEFDVLVGVVFATSAPTRLNIVYGWFAGDTVGFEMSVVRFDLDSDPLSPPTVLWSLPTMIDGSKELDLLVEGVFGLTFRQKWTTEAGSANAGGISVTFTEVPAPGALGVLGAVGLVGARRRR